MQNRAPREPGDLILDRYMPNATPEEREEARANLKACVEVLMRIQLRITREAEDKAIRTNDGRGVN